MTTCALTYNLVGNVRHQGLSVAGVTVAIFDLYRGQAVDLISVPEKPTAITKTGKQGEFAFSVKPGIYRLELLPDPNTRFLRHSVQEITVTNNTTYNFSLFTGSIFTVKPVTKSGATLPPGEVVALGIEPTSYFSSAKANHDGTYTLVLPRGKYHFALRSTRITEELGELQRTEAPFLSTTISVCDVARDDFTEILIPQFVKFQGHLTNMSGRPIANATVKLMPAKAPDKLLLADLGLNVSCKTNASGMFEILVAPDTYDLAVEPDESGRLFGITESNIEIAYDLTKNFHLAEGHRLRGRVLFDDKPLSQCLVRIQAIDDRLELIVKTDADGHFTAGVPGGSFKVIVSAHPKSTPTITHDGEEFSGLAPWTKVVVVGGDTHVAVRMQRGTPLHGKILDSRGQTITGAKICAYADSTLKKEAQQTPLATCMTDTEGKYCFLLAAGTYSLVVEDDQDNAYKVEIGENPVNFDIDSQGLCQLVFEVTGESGQKVPRCKVSYKPYGSTDPGLFGDADNKADRSKRGYALTGDDGICRVKVQAGVYALRFDPPIDGSFTSKVIKQISIMSDLSRPITLPLKSASNTDA